MPQARKRSILREEASGVIETLKRLERTNPSVRMNRMEVDFEGGRIQSYKDTEKARSHESFSWNR